MAELEEKKRLKEEKERARLEKQQNVAYTLQELYKRILKVEKLTEIVRDGDLIVA